MAKEVHLTKVERLPDGVELFDESFGAPQRHVVGAIRATRSELVVVDDATVRGQIAQHREATASSARTAVQKQQRNPIVGPHDSVPHSAARYLHETFRLNSWRWRRRSR